MKARIPVFVVAFLLALIPVLGAAAAPPAPAVRYLFRTPGIAVPGPFDVVNQVAEFGPGTGTAYHTHPGLVLVTVLSGELTYRTPRLTPDNKRAYKAGESFLELPGVVGEATNPGTVPARIVVTFLAPQGVPLATPDPAAPPPPLPATAPPLILFRTAGIAVPEPFEVAHQVLDFAPGAATPPQTHPGQVVVTVMEGELTFTTQGVTKVYKAGDSFTEMPGVAGEASNAGTTRATVLASFLLPQGAPLSTTVAMPGLPSTGAGGAAHRSSAPLAALLLGGVLLAAGGWGLRRRFGRA